MSKILTPDELEMRQVEIFLGQIMEFLIKAYNPTSTTELSSTSLGLHGSNEPMYIYLDNVRDKAVNILKENHWEVEDLAQPYRHLNIKRASSA